MDTVEKLFSTTQWPSNHFLATLCMFLFVHQFVINTAIAQEEESDAFTVRFSEPLQLLSIQASDVKLIALIEELGREHEIYLFIPDLDEDATFSADIDRKFIDEALREAIPSDFRFFYRQASDRDVAAPAQEKPMLQNSSLSDDSPKDTSLQYQDRAEDVKEQVVSSEAMKEDVSSTTQDTLPTDQRMGAFESIQERSSDGDQQGQTTSTQAVVPSDANYYAKLLVKVTENGIEPVRLHRMEGPLPQANRLEGDLIYYAKEGGDILYSQVVDDPLQQRSHSQEGGGHHLSRAREALLNITLPASILDRARRAQTTIEFFEFTASSRSQGVTVLSAVQSDSQPRGVISSKALLELDAN